MNRIAGVGVLLAVAVALGGCAAGAPTVGLPPTATVPALAAVQATAPAVAPVPTATPIPPTATRAPGPTATARPATPDPQINVGSSALDFAAQQAGRPAPPADPGTGELLTYYRGPSDRKEVALTFDAGADTGYAAAILDELRDQGVKASFGMTGKWAEDNPDLVRRMIDEGHQIFNHTYDHLSFTGTSTGTDVMSQDQLTDELNRTDQIVRDLTGGYQMKPYFRPPYGDIGPITSGYVYQTGYYVNIMWTCDTFGWNGWTADQIVDRCTSPDMAQPGEIILLHVGAAAAGDYEALPGLIDFFRGQGYQFVTIEQMLQP